jgi:hypothetical protein
MKPPKFTIILEGSKKDDGKLRLEEFMQGLSVIVEALKETERRLGGYGKSKTQYKIVHLSQKSPMTMTVEPINGYSKEEEIKVNPKSTINTFISNLSVIKRRKVIPENLDYESLQKYSRIGELRKTHISEITIKNGRKKVKIDEKFRKNIHTAIGDDEYEEGSLVGTLETINIHGKKQFYIYPTLGAKKVQCIFKPEMKEEVKQALYERIEVVGILRYKSWDKFPYAINVKAINIYPPDDELPTFSELVGTIPTQEISPTQLIRNMRDEGW